MYPEQSLKLGLAVMVSFLLSINVASAGCDDLDGDGFVGEAGCGTEPDCNDHDPDVFPGAQERCDGLDNDCRFGVDDGLACEQGCPLIHPSPVSVQLPETGLASPNAVWTGTTMAFAWSTATAGVEQILFRLGGRNAGTTMLTPGAAVARGPSMSWSGSSFGLAWWEETIVGEARVFFARVNAQGHVVVPRTTTSASITARWPSLAWNGSGFGIVWGDERSGTSQIYFAELGPDGTAQGPELRIHESATNLEFPSLVWTGSGYAVTWVVDDAMNGGRDFVRLDASGSPIGETQRLTSSASDLAHTAMVWTGTELGLAWADDRFGNAEIVFSRATDEGVQPSSRASFDSARSDRPTLSWNGEGYALAWHDQRDDEPGIYFRRISPEGLLDGPSFRWLQAQSDSSFEPALVWTGSEHRLLLLAQREAQQQLLLARLGCSFVDKDLDTFADCADDIPCDCADTQASIFPGAPEMCDGLNNNCDDPAWPALPRSEQDLDLDGFTQCAECDDTTALRFPGQNEVLCDDLDNDCNGIIDDVAGVDTDGDLVGDTCDRCPLVADPDQTDTDGDGFGEVCDNCPTVADPTQRDDDADGIGEVCDNCPELPNPEQSDVDGDGFGDECDPCIFDPDSDEDILCGPNDNCPDVTNPDQSDVDEDGVGDVCDNCPEIPNSSQSDTDLDQIADACDNCPLMANPAQEDFDQDQQGDRCDPNDAHAYIQFVNQERLFWTIESSTRWNVYVSDLAELRTTGAYTQPTGSNAIASRACRLSGNGITTSITPDSGAVAAYLVSAIVDGIEQELGGGFTGVQRPNDAPCP